jgi:hypothetical protein
MSSRAMIVVGTLLLAWAAWLGTAQAEPISFKVPLSGGQEVPPVFPRALVRPSLHMTQRPAS